MPWYGVKSAFRTRILPKRSKASREKPPRTIVEERIILVRADSSKAALAKARLEAQRYLDAKPGGTNALGERVRTTWLCEQLDAFWLFEDPGDGLEVFSSTRMVPESKPDEAVSDLIFGPPWRAGEDLERSRFIDGGIAKKLIAETTIGAPRKRPKRRR